MKYVKILGLLAVAAASLMAFAGSASATTITSPTGTAYTNTITAVSEGATSLDGAFSTVTCKASHVAGKVESHGSGVTAKGNLTALSFSECNFPVTVEAFGSLEVHPVTTNAENKVVACASGECTGTLTSTGAKVKIHTSVGECVFTTENTDVGLITPTNDTGGTATFDIGAHGTGKIPRTAGNFLCGSSGQWTGSYSVTVPDSLYIDA
jgi:hypothetical protein